MNTNKDLAWKMAELENKETDNAIFTLNTMYFFKCAKKQGFGKEDLNSEIAKILQISKEKANDIIYRFAYNYFSYEKMMTCVEYIVKCEKGELKVE